MPRTKMRSRALGVCLPLLAAMAVLTVGHPARVSAQPSVQRQPLPDNRPNVVLILTDDQRDGTVGRMPNVVQELVRKGTTYTRAMVPTSLCCPSRATILTGLYAHDSRLFGNGDVGGARYGGWRRFHRLGLEQRTLGPALHAQGYRTGLIGKYLNFFGKYAEPGYVPPGWDTFAAIMAPHGAYYAYRLSDGTAYGTAPADYSTDVLAERADEFITSTPIDQPLFLYFAPFGPHAPYTPAPRHLDTYAGRLPEYTAATLTSRRSTMPLWMEEREHVTQAEVDLTRERQTEALLSIDDAVGGIVSALRRTGRERNTLFIFMSDNGYFWGEHGIIGKDSPYDESTRIPMVLRWDGHVPADARDGRIVLNVDVARTITKATGTAMQTDGLDILGPRTRAGFVLEAMNGYHDRPAYCGYRTRHRMFVQWATGEQEMFDYRLDPDEQHNLAHRRAWQDVKHRLKGKAKLACRPLPPHFHW